MAENRARPNNLRAGEFYGLVPQKKLVSPAILSEVVHNRAVDVPEHSHELAYFTLVLEGAYSENFAGRARVHRPMAVVWHRAGISHKDRIQNGGRFFTVEIQARGLENLSRFAPVPEDFYESGGALAGLGCRLYHEFKSWQLCSALVAEGITLEMLAYAARRRGAAGGAASEKRRPAWFSRVLEKLNEEFTENLSTEQLALEAGVHPVYLASVFRQFERQTIGEYVQKLRVDYAARLLAEREMPLAEIACAAGFSDQSHLTRVFKRRVGLTPGAFRNTLE